MNAYRKGAYVRFSLGTAFREGVVVLVDGDNCEIEYLDLAGNTRTTRRNYRLIEATRKPPPLENSR